MSAVTVRFARIGHVEVPVPAYQSELAAGLDLQAALAADVVIEPQQTALIPTGLAMALPIGFEGQVRPRSGLALKFSITVLNSPGTIDADYRGELKVLLINHGAAPFVVRPLDRIAQLVIAPVTRAAFVVVAELDSTVRGDGGYGSTGT